MPSPMAEESEDETEEMVLQKKQNLALPGSISKSNKSVSVSVSVFVAKDQDRSVIESIGVKTTSVGLMKKKEF